MATMRDNSQTETIEMMVNVVNLFGAKDNRVVIGEMAKVYSFWQAIPVSLKMVLKNIY